MVGPSRFSQQHREIVTLQRPDSIARMLLPYVVTAPVNVSKMTKKPAVHQWWVFWAFFVTFTGAVTSVLKLEASNQFWTITQSIPTQFGWFLAQNFQKIRGNNPTTSETQKNPRVTRANHYLPTTHNPREQASGLFFWGGLATTTTPRKQGTPAIFLLFFFFWY